MKRRVVLVLALLLPVVALALPPLVGVCPAEKLCAVVDDASPFDVLDIDRPDDPDEALVADIFGPVPIRDLKACKQWCTAVCENADDIPTCYTDCMAWCL